MTPTTRIDKEKVKRQMRRVKIRRFAELARQVGVSPQAVSRWFGGSPFSPDSLGALVVVLDCTPNDVLVWGDEAEEQAAGAATKYGRSVAVHAG